jgi:hypothetical protein
LPSHLPVWPQVDAGAAVHIPRGSTAPGGTGWHDPALPATLQAWQEPHAICAQQTPSTQKPLAHSGPAPQPAPTGLSPQLPAAQTFGLMQSVLPAQVVLHALAAPHW